MEREVLLTGIGGQGIQLAARILAQAANQEGRNVMHFGVYGGMIRGGPSDCTIVASTGEILAPPIVEEAWALIAMHGGSLAAALGKIRAGGVVLSNSTLVSPAPTRRDVVVLEVPATRLAEEGGKIVGASMVALGAFVEATGFVSAEALVGSMKAAIPPHRQALIEFNRACLERGAAYVRGEVSVPAQACAWPEVMRGEVSAPTG